MSVWMVDVETYSEADLKKVGAWKYAEHPSTEILLLAIARDDGPVELWDSREELWGRREKMLGASRAELLIKEMLTEDDGPIVAHNASFEQAIFHYRCVLDLDYPPPPLERWHCSAAMCRRAAIPWSLKDAAKFLNLADQKVDAGAALIKLFSVPTDKVAPEGAWEDFGRYCVQDVKVMREIFHRLKKSFSLENEPGFFLDARLNQRGIPVNRAALRTAETMVKGAMETLTAEFRSITGLNPTQRDKVLCWLRERGYPGEDLQSATMEAALEEPMWETSPEAYRALELRAGGSFAALAKIPAMLGSACEDGRIRGAFLWHGAHTGRWSGRLIQPQNFKRPTIRDTHLAYEALKNGASADDLENIFGPIPEVLASCARHFIELEGSQMLNADYAQIEARVVAWLCGQSDLLENFRKGVDVYKVMASSIFRVPVDAVTKDQRFTAKITVLSAGYGTGWKRFQSMCKLQGLVLDDETCQRVIKTYREEMSNVVDTWKAIEAAAQNAINAPGKRFTVNGKLTFRFGNLKSSGFTALQMQLPSGRMITYPKAFLKKCWRRKDEEGVWAKVLDDPKASDWEVEEIRFWGRSTAAQWNWNATFSARLLENACQGVAGDFLTHGMMEAERAGYGCFATIHDEVLCVYEDGHSVEEFSSLLCSLPDWAPDFPLDASCALVPFYTK